jgi:hypothetical protein
MKILGQFRLVVYIVVYSVLFNSEDGGDMFLRNVTCLSTNYTALYPRRYSINLHNHG